tara:strand:- start:64 stop:210 length:147 start_codon:yes stop_codon:yes gene_type:complete
MNNMVDGMGGMTWGMGLLWLVVIALVVLGIVALIKYVFFGSKRERNDD